MSVKVTGSEERLSLAMPGEGQTWVRQGGEMIGANTGAGAGQLFHGWAHPVSAGTGVEQVFNGVILGPGRALDGTALGGITNTQGGVLCPAGELANLRVRVDGLPVSGPHHTATVTVLIDGEPTTLTITLSSNSQGGLPGPLPVIAGQVVQLLWSVDVTDGAAAPVAVELIASVEFSPS